MFAEPDSETIFFMTMYQLKKFCEDSAFQIDRLTDQKNFELFTLLEANSFVLTSELEKQIVDLLAQQRKVELFNVITQQIKTIISNPNKFQSIPKESPKILESMLWLLRKFKTSAHLNEVRQAILAAYGNNTLEYLEQFSHVNLEEIENRFEVEISPNVLKNYVTQIKELYMPQGPSNGIPVNRINNNGHNNSINNNMNNSNSNHRPGVIIKNNVEPMHVEVPAMMNRSNGFNFQKNSSNLQISIVKGLKKDNIEFYDQMEPALRASGDIFTDETFPPEPSSLTSSVAEFPLAHSIVWRRISEVYRSRKIALCSDQIGPNDIHQGQLGDCYFLSALSVLAERKHFIKRLFHSKEISSTGCYSVWLCDSGEWKNMIIDDYVPCIGGEPCFSRSKGSDIWVLLLEKAFAKLYGNYYNIDGGFLSEALAALTGAPTKYFAQKENGISPLEQIWLYVTGSLQNKFIVTAASQGENNAINNSQMGIISNHAYAILDAQEVQTSPGESHRLIKIRNPWGRHKWRGDWSDNSPYWTPELKMVLDYDPHKEDGIFWMSLIDFDTHFDSICSCEVQDDYYFAFLRLGENKKQNFFVSKMTTDADGFVYLTVQQKMKKHFKGNANYDYSFIRVFLAKLDENGKVTSLVHGKYKHGQSVVIRKNLQKGTYLVFIEVDWIQKLYNELNLTAYSKVKVDMQEEALSQYNIPSLYEDLLKAYIYKSGDKKIKTRQYEGDGSKIQAFQYKLDKFGLVAVLFSNKEKNIVVHNRLTITQINNMELYVPFDTNGVCIESHVYGGQERMIILKAKMEDKVQKAFSYQYSELYKIAQNFTKEQLKQLCRERGQRTQSLNGGQIEAYTLKYLGGYADYYVNKGTYGVLQEEILFDVDNVLVNGEFTNRLEIFVMPGEDFLVDMRAKNPYEGSRYNRKTRTLVV